MASLDISLNTWSLIIFVIQTLSMFGVVVTFIKPVPRIIISVMILWVLNQTLFIVYGYSTEQIGFLLLGVINILVSIFASIIKFGSIDDHSGEEYVNK